MRHNVFSLRSTGTRIKICKIPTFLHLTKFNAFPAIECFESHISLQKLDWIFTEALKTSTCRFHAEVTQCVLSVFNTRVVNLRGSFNVDLRPFIMQSLTDLIEWRLTVYCTKFVVLHWYLLVLLLLCSKCILALKESKITLFDFNSNVRVQT